MPAGAADLGAAVDGVGRMTFAAEIEAYIGPERIEACVVGAWPSHNEPPPIAIPPERVGVPVQWGEAREWLAYEASHDFGGADCHPVYLWTPTRVVVIREYDGSTSIGAVPRHPIHGEAAFL